MGIKIVTDSSSDLNPELQIKYDITIVPLTVQFEKESFKDRSEISPKEFFRKLEDEEKIPSTSQVNPKEFETVFKKIIDNGDEVLGIFISSELSGTYSSAVIAKEFLDSEKIRIIDSRLVTLSLSLLVVKAGEMVEAGKSSDEIISTIKEDIFKIETFIIVDTLDYLRKGGRLSASQAFIGGILNLKPILTFKEGKLVPMDKVRGRKKALKWVKNWIDTNEFNLSNKKVALVHAMDQEYMNQLKDILVNDYGVVDIIESEVGAIVGTHSGPSAIAMSFINS